MGKKPKAQKNNKNQTTVSSSPLGCILLNELYLAPVSVTSNPDLLKRDGITHVISIGKNPAARFDGITYHKFGLLDDEDANLIPIVEKVCEVLDGILPSPAPQLGEAQGIGQGGERDTRRDEDEEGANGESMDIATSAPSQGQPHPKLLIHCSAAISRSPAVAAGYLMKSRGMTLRESLEVLVNAREVISPNVGFLRQLCELEGQLWGLKGEKGTFDMDSLKGSGKLRKALGV